MTAVMRIETINFTTLKRGTREVRGITDGALYGLMKHNSRKKFNKSFEVKSKQATNIDSNRSHFNHYFKKMNTSHIKKIETITHRKNQVGAFQMVFDFQDLVEEDSIKFHNIDYAKQKAKLILAYLKEQNILEHFELIEMINHNDEKNPHFHLTFSAYDTQNQGWGYNEFFSPIVSYKPIMKNGEAIYQKYNRGKQRGEYKLDNRGNKTPKTQAVRKPILQNLQDSWNDFLIKHNQPYRNKKEFSSLLQYGKGTWRSFSQETKEKVYAIRKKEVEVNRALFTSNKSNYTRLKKELVMLFNDLQTQTDRARNQTFKLP